MEKILRIFDFLSMGFCLGLAIILVGMFFDAFFTSGQVLVTINMYGEQWIEVVLFPLYIVMGVITFTRLGKRIVTTERNYD